MTENNESRKVPKIETQNNWKTNFPYLKFTSTGMQCCLCLKFNDSLKLKPKIYNESFINGSKNYRKSAVKDHMTSSMHDEAKLKDEEQKAKEAGTKVKRIHEVPSTSQITKSIGKMGVMTTNQKQNLIKLFHLAYYLGKKGRPYTDYIDLLELEKLHDVKFFDSSAYENTTSVKEFIHFCSQSIFETDIKQKVQRSNFVR